MTAPELAYADVSIGLRAPRVAVVFDGGDHWTFWIRQAIYEATRTWGGAGFIFLPHCDGNLHPYLLAAATAYDPDYVVQLRPTFAQWEALDPGHIAMRDAATGQPLNREARAAALASSGDVFVRDPVTAAARAKVASWCSVYRRKLGTDDPFYEDTHFLEGERADNQLPRVSDQIATVAHLTVPPNWTGFIGVAAGLKVGSSSPPGLAVDMQLDEQVTESAIGWILREAGRWAGSPPESFIQPSDTPPADSRAAPTAFAAGSLGLGWVSSGIRYPNLALIVVGDAASDCALAFAYKQIYGLGFWLPSTWRIDDEDNPTRAAVLARMALDHAVGGPNGGQTHFVVTSTSLTEDELRQTRDILTQPWISTITDLDGNTPTEGNALDDRVSVGSPTWPSRGKRHLALAEEFGQRFALPVRREPNGDIVMVAPPPVPMIRDAAMARTLDLAWHVDVGLLDSNSPRGKGLPAETMLAREDEQYLTWLRSGRGGISYQSKRFDLILSGTPPELQLARPRLRAPGMLTWATAIAAISNYRVRLSDAGIRANLLAEMWGSRRALSESLDGGLLAALRKFGTKGSSTRDAFPDGGGCLVAKLGAFLSFEGFQKYWGEVNADVSEIRDTIDHLTDIGVLRRGLILLCPVCTRPSFTSVDLLGQRNPCAQCGSISSLSRTMWKAPVEEPTWYYDLHPAGRELLRDNGIEPLLLSALWRRKDRQYADLPEIELMSGLKGRAEVDLLAHLQGRVVTAEVKTSRSLGTTKDQREAAVRKRILAAEVLRADDICLATTASSWELASLDALKSAVEFHDWPNMEPPLLTVVTSLGTPDATEKRLDTEREEGGDPPPS